MRFYMCITLLCNYKQYPQAEMSGIFHLLVRMMAQSGDQVGRAYVVRAILEHMSNITYEGNISMQQMEVSTTIHSVTNYTAVQCTLHPSAQLHCMSG
jgi:hypothetical protein